MAEDIALLTPDRLDEVMARPVGNHLFQLMQSPLSPIGYVRGDIVVAKASGDFLQPDRLVLSARVARSNVTAVYVSPRPELRRKVWGVELNSEFTTALVDMSLSDAKFESTRNGAIIEFEADNQNIVGMIEAAVAAKVLDAQWDNGVRAEAEDTV